MDYWTSPEPLPFTKNGPSFPVSPCARRQTASLQNMGIPGPGVQLHPFQRRRAFGLDDQQAVRIRGKSLFFVSIFVREDQQRKKHQPYWESKFGAVYHIDIWRRLQQIPIINGVSYKNCSWGTRCKIKHQSQGKLPCVQEWHIIPASLLTWLQMEGFFHEAYSFIWWKHQRNKVISC